VATRRRFVQARGFRRGTSWSRLVETGYTAVAASTKVLLGSFTSTRTETAIRTRGMISVKTDTPASAEVQLGAFGVVVVSDAALAAGAASIPGPVTDAQDEGWMVWQPFMQSHLVAGLTVVTMLSKEYQFDSKAARRVDLGYSLALMVENASASNAFDVALALSLLTKVNT